MAESKDKRNNLTGDLPAEEDKLGFTPYVIAIAEFLTNPKTKAPLTISIEGEWGSGKSSFMRQLKKRIEDEKSKSKAVWFNAWRHDKAEALWAVFALEFIRQISRKRHFLDFSPILCSGKLVLNRLFFNNYSDDDQLPVIARISVRKSVSKIIQIAVVILVIFWLGSVVTVGMQVFHTSNQEKLQQEQNNPQQEQNNTYSPTPKMSPSEFVFEKIKIIGPVALFISASIPLLKYIIGDIKDDLKKIIQSPKYREQVPFIEAFHEELKEVVKAYVGKNERVYVFIDDLDRCELGKSAELLQALNLMISDNSNLVFILGMDREKVAASITFKQKDILDFLPSLKEENQENSINKNHSSIHKLNYGFSYMEKFIQLPFSVPKPSEENILKDLLGRDKEVVESELGVFPIIEKEFSQKDYEGVMKMVIDFFDNNPRRLKQYINLLRLRSYIAYYSIGVEEELEKLTIEQIGKFVALTLKHPRLLLELQKNNELLAELEEYANENKYHVDKYIAASLQDNSNKGNANYWINSDPKIKTLLKICNGENENKSTSLKKESIKKLLDISPQGIPAKYFKLREFLNRKRWFLADLTALAITARIRARYEKKDQWIKIKDKLWKKYKWRENYSLKERDKDDREVGDFKNEVGLELLFVEFQKDKNIEKIKANLKKLIQVEYFPGKNDFVDGGFSSDEKSKFLNSTQYLEKLLNFFNLIRGELEQFEKMEKKIQEIIKEIDDNSQIINDLRKDLDDENAKSNKRSPIVTSINDVVLFLLFLGCVVVVGLGVGWLVVWAVKLGIFWHSFIVSMVIYIFAGVAGSIILSERGNIWPARAMKATEFWFVKIGFVTGFYSVVVRGIIFITVHLHIQWRN